MGNKVWNSLFLSLIAIFFGTMIASAQSVLPSVSINLGTTNSPEEFSKGVQLLVVLTVLTLAPSILIMSTSFIRMVIVLSLTRQAIGTSSLPPSQIIVGLALILTFFVMAPTFNKINTQAFQPYMKNEITQQEALKKSVEPLREFMFRQTEEQELALFINLAQIDAPKVTDDIPTYVLLPSFIISELKTAFKIGFMIFIPFLVIDIVVASILVSMGMLFLPPPMIATPFKIILFVLIDGWHLITKSLVEGFMT
ncbi:MAG: flagellar type III secretion system pore protein FliP [Candidatus Gastranaerophilales bacterium]|nr:flagellar type III secretion system pore protein FliP [Candidatus Gastranaerophilales bacterium]